MLDYFHSNSVNGDLDINTIMIVPCGVFVSTILFGVFFSLSLLLGIFLQEKSFSRFKLSGRKTGQQYTLQGEGIACYLWISYESKNVDNMIPRNMI